MKKCQHTQGNSSEMWYEAEREHSLEREALSYITSRTRQVKWSFINYFACFGLVTLHPQLSSFTSGALIHAHNGSFAGDVLLPASSVHDLQRAAGRFAAEHEAVEMGISAPKSEATALCWKTPDCSLCIGSELLPQAKEFKYLGVLFMSEGKMEHEMDRQIGAASAVMWPVYRTILMKRAEPGGKTYQSIQVPYISSFMRFEVKCLNLTNDLEV